MLVRGWPHVIGQPFAHARPHWLEIDACPTAADHECRKHVRAVIVAEQLHDCLRHHRIVGDHRLDLGQFDAEPPDFNLGVDAPDEFDVTHRIKPDQVTRPIDQRRFTIRGGKRRAHELFGGEVGPVDIARAHARSADDQFALGSRAHRPQVFVDHPSGVAGQWAADRHAAAGLNLGPRRGHRGFGRAVRIEQPQAGARPAIDQFGRASLTAEVDQPQRGHRGFNERKQRRHHVPHGRLFGDQRQRHVGPGLGQRLGRHQQQRAGEERAPHRFDRHVERQAEPAEHLVVRLQPQDRTFGPHQMAGVGVRDHHALGPPGRARGIDDIGKITWVGAGFGSCQRRDGLCCEITQRSIDHERQHRHRRRALAVGYNQTRARVPYDKVDAVLRVGPVNRHVSGAGPQDAENGHVLV